MNKDEKIIEYWSGVERGVDSTTGEYVEAYGSQSNGLLVLADQKLAWLSKLSLERGEYSIKLRIPLEQIVDVSSRTNPISYVAVTDTEGPHAFDLFSQVDQPRLDFRLQLQ